MGVTLVLDTSAILAYARRSLAVGELLAVVNEDGDSTAVPAACLVEAAAHVNDADVDMLRLLVGLPGVEASSLKASVALGMGALARTGGGVAMAHAATEALTHGAQVATRDARTAAVVLPDGWDIIEID